MAIQNRLVPLHDALFAETSPGPVKYRRRAAGQDLGTLPPAAGAAAAPTRERVNAAMTEVGLLN